MASLYRNVGRYADAEPLQKKALAILEKAFGPDHPTFAQAMNNLAELFREQGRYADAEPLYKRALATWERAFGPDHPDVAQSLNNLAALYADNGRHSDAEPLYKRSLAIREKLFGPTHPDVAQSLNNLAWIYWTQGQNPDALQMVHRTISIGFVLKSIALRVLFSSRAGGQLPSDRGVDDSLNVIQRDSQTSTAAALNMLNVRFSAGNDRLAQLVRKDQDLATEVERLDRTIVEAASKEPSKRDGIAEQQIRYRLDEASKERNDLQQVLARDFPNYAALSKPEPLITKEIQSLLDNDEALVVIDLDEKSYVWVVTKDRADWKTIQIPADSDDCGRGFRLNAATRSDRRRPPVPTKAAGVSLPA